MPTLRPHLLRTTLLPTIRPTPRSTPHLRHQANPYSTKPSDPTPPLPHAPSPEPPKQPSRVGAFYRNNTYPVLKAFLTALFTYQLAYYVWLRLEVVEEKVEQGERVRGLEEEVRRAVEGRRVVKEGVVKEVGEKVEEVKEETKRRGWWPW